MIYTKQTKKALNIAYNAHNGQLDKGGMPYIFHPFYIAMHMDTEEEIITALLHDVLEDTDITLDDLKKEGFGENILCALSLLCHDEKDEYMDYIKKIKNNPLARKVKLVDLANNSMLERIDTPSQKDYLRIEKYKKAIAILNS